MIELAIQPLASNAQILMLGQLIIGLLIIAAILIQVRNYRMGKLLIRDKTVMFAGFINREDYDAVIQAKGHLFRLIPEEELNKSVTEPTTITENEKYPGSLKKE